MLRKFYLLTSLIALWLSGCASAAPSPTAAPPPSADLSAIKAYAQNNAQFMAEGTAALHTTAQAYYDLMARYGFDYPAAWSAEPAQLAQLAAEAKTHWSTASQYYELNEGIVAGVPALSRYDVWLDAGPSAAEDPAAAYAWSLPLPDGTTLESPGNFFHSLLEPTIWGTKAEFTGLAVDLDGNGQISVGEALPEAAVLLAAAEGLDSATAELTAALAAWQPTPTDAFTALVVMIPTMNEYFEQWKLSSYVAGPAAEESAFIGFSRLFDINGILAGLDVTYENMAPLVAAQDPTLHAQITAGFADLRGYVADLYGQEQAGTQFTAEQADLFGTEAQQKATALAGQVSQAAALLNITIAE